MSLEDTSTATPRFSLAGTHRAKCVDVYDGDTAQFVIEIGGTFARFTCRLNGINAAEIKSPDPAEREKAIRARDYLRSIMLGQIVELRVDTFDKYGRLLVDAGVHVGSDYIPSICAHMIERGLVAKYDGSGEKNW